MKKFIIILFLLMFMVIPASAVNVYPSGELQHSNNTTYTTTSNTLINLSTIQEASSLCGLFNVSFQAYSTGGSPLLKEFQLYSSNNTTVGTLFNNDNGYTWEWKNETISACLSAGDYLVLKASKSIDGSDVSVRNFMVYYDVVWDSFNISSDNKMVSVYNNGADFYYTLNVDSSNITENDALEHRVFVTISDASNVYDSNLTQYENTVACSNSTLSRASCNWITPISNETIDLNIVGDDVYMNRSVTSIGNNTYHSIETHIPLLTDVGEGYDFVLMNSTLSATDQATLVPPIPDGGLPTRHADYDQNVYVSSIDDKYFIINMSGTSGITQSVEDKLVWNGSIWEGHQLKVTAQHNKFSFGFINNTTYPVLPNHRMNEGDTAYLNITFSFPVTSTMLPENLGLINYSRFNDTSIFPNVTIATDAKHMVESVLLSRFLSNYYPNGSLPILFDGQTLYRYQRTTLSVYRIIEGLYFFGDSIVREIANDWFNTADYDSVLYSESSISRFETNGSGYIVSDWGIASSSLYSGTGTLYTNSSLEPSVFYVAGDEITIYYSKWNGAGIANVSINGVNNSLDMYDAGALFQQSMSYSLGNWSASTINATTYSEVRIYWTGTKNVSSSGTQIDFDRFDVSRNDMKKQRVGYILRELNALNYTYSVFPFKERINISINGTTYPYNLTLYSTAYSNRGATSYVAMENILVDYAIYSTDGNNTWLAAEVPILEERMQWTKQMFYENSTDLLRIPIWMGSHSFHDASYFTGYDSVDNSLYIQTADIIAGFYDVLNNTIMQNYWVAERDAVKTAMQKDITDGGLWKNESVGGHFILSKEPNVVRIEAEESEFINRSNWISYNDTTTVWDNGRKISGRAERAWSVVQRGTEDSAKIYYINNSTYPMIYSFYGTGISLVHGESHTRGILNVTVDNITYQIDQYNASCGTWCVDVVTDINLSLPLQNHTVIFEWSGTKNASAADYIVDIDAVDIYNYTLEGFPAYSMTPMSVGMFDEWYKNATVDWIEDRDSGLKTDYTYPYIDLEYGADDAVGSSWKMTYGQMAFFNNTNSFEDGGHFSVVAALYSRVKNDYIPMQQFVELESGKYGILEWMYDNGSMPAISAVFETQMAGGFLMGYVPFWGGDYEVTISETTIPETFVNPPFVAPILVFVITTVVVISSWLNRRRKRFR